MTVASHARAHGEKASQHSDGHLLGPAGNPPGGIADISDLAAGRRLRRANAATRPACAQTASIHTGPVADAATAGAGGGCGTGGRSGDADLGAPSSGRAPARPLPARVGPQAWRRSSGPGTPGVRSTGLAAWLPARSFLQVRVTRNGGDRAAASGWCVPRRAAGFSVARRSPGKLARALSRRWPTRLFPGRRAPCSPSCR